MSARALGPAAIHNQRLCGCVNPSTMAYTSTMTRMVLRSILTYATLSVVPYMLNHSRLRLLIVD
eukprot:1504744-Pyramimonas_sp.AAC.2